MSSMCEQSILKGTKASLVANQVSNLGNPSSLGLNLKKVNPRQK